jgi:hypothetical protein
MLTAPHEEVAVSTAARILGLSSRRVIQLCDAGKLTHRRTALGRLIPRAAAEDLARARQSEPEGL